MAPSNSAVANIAVAALLFATSIPSSSAFVPVHSTIARAPSIPPSSLIGDEISTTSTTSTSLPAIRRGGGRRAPVRQVKEFVPPMNDEIKHSEVRVSVGTKDGKDESLGIMSKSDALAKARDLGGLDLILINANSDPPVCKIVDYSKYRYALEKKRKEKAKNSKAVEIKEVKMSYKIGTHDYNVRLKAATKFIKQGNRVKATVQFRGREQQHDKLGVTLLEKLAEDLEGIGNMEGRPRREGRFLSSIISPLPEVVKSINEKKRSKEKEKKKAKEESLNRRNEKLEAKKAAVEEENAAIGGVLDDIGLDEDEDFDDDDIDDADLDELLGSSKVADDLFA